VIALPTFFVLACESEEKQHFLSTDIASASFGSGKEVFLRDIQMLLNES